LAGISKPHVAVNVSARNLSSASFASSIVRALHDANVDAQRLYIEVTETALMTDPVRAAAALGELDRAGVRLSIDDFGSARHHWPICQRCRFTN